MHCFFAKGLSLYPCPCERATEVRSVQLLVFLSVSFSLSLSLYDSLNLEFVSCSLIDFYCLLDIKTIIIWGFYCVLSHL